MASCSCGGAVDIVVSDIDLPRMNGFDLTTRIRGDGKFAMERMGGMSALSQL
jgi:CheY-like chemotaxis protein